MESAVTTENYREVLSWLRGGDMTPDPKMEDRFIEVVAAMVQERLKTDEQRQREKTASERAERRRQMVGKVPGIRSIVDELVAIEKSASELDSFVLAKALSYMGVLEGRLLNMSQIQIILYVAYGTWLVQKGSRLTVEHPQMWQFGPVFPRAYSRFRKDTGDGKEEYCRLQSETPEAFNLLKRGYRKYAWTKASVLTAPHIADGTPWSLTRKKSPDKWGVTIEDSDIAVWFKKRIGG